MTIIVDGAKDFHRAGVYFICGTCGCIFQAEHGEYKKHQNQVNKKVWYSCDCPNCGTEIIVDENEETESGYWNRFDVAPVWHDAKEDPPKTPGLYCGKKDKTNSMWPVNYRDGVWTLDCYPDHKMDILQWAEYAAFGRCEDDE